ncbi:epidermal growth factor receptor kinase substrate 8-like protein 1 [Ornithorhynchus anatinus]|uniref:epidermal growth factor receptor kinase substrate 8-like protein 1 n=1 Tax=Ornithorhynchus anatinus TaxID=9258 RepID=UPI0019D46A6E|nr:epidermal growth factor receptor kinase substrate 8-like protein 1 [Ornithorhynchus anatinus]
MSSTHGLDVAPKPSAKSIYEQRKKYSTVVMADVSQYAVNHLVTFCLGEDDGVHTVEDATRKLAAMDAQARVWAQEMLLQVSSAHVKLLDVDSKEELESYALSSIVRCDTILPTGQTRSLLLLVCQEPDRLQPDVHFFQCLSLGAELIREDITGALQAYRSGSGDRRAAALRATEEELSRPPAPHSAEASPLHRRASTRVVLARQPAEPAERPLEEEGERAGGEGGATGGRTNRRAAAHPDSQSTGPSRPAADAASVQAERDVALLNHVFDDVESFVGKLQKAAEASRVLEHRERGRRARRRTAGEGLLTLRSKPPSVGEYTDILQKIKYSFSLLARLRSNITNPSSQELLHFLFGPLQMMVDTSGGPKFAEDIRRPQLTGEAVTLLRETLNPQESALWASLGDFWTKSRLELPASEAALYTPVFYSGWQPPATDPQGQPWEDPVEKQHQHERRRSQQSAPQIAANGHTDSDPRSEQQPEGKWVRCNYDFQARNSSELSVSHRDVLEVLDDSRKWWKVRDQWGKEGFVPYNILSPHPGPRPHNGLHGQNPSPGRSVPQIGTPPPPRAPAPSRPRWGSSDNIYLDPADKEKFSQLLSVNEELVERLAHGRPGGGPRPPASPRTPEPHLSPRSGAAEVRVWLEHKGFGPQTVSALGVLTGAQLFSLQKEEFKAVSPEEGARLYSQVTVQRALLEDSEKVSELEAAMEKQKKKVEGPGPVDGDIM